MKPRPILMLVLAVLSATCVSSRGRGGALGQCPMPVPRSLEMITAGAGSFPSGLVALGDKVVFVALSPMEGRQIWVTDGTRDGTQRLTSAPYPALTVQESIGVLGGAAIWRMSSGLWRSDGTVAGTYMLAALPTQQGVTNSVILDGVLMIGVRNSTVIDAPFTLYRTDGTIEGTRVLSTSVPYYNRTIAACAGRVYFAAADAATGVELWSTDGTVTGTSLAVDLTPAEGVSSGIGWVVSDGTRVYLTANIGIGQEVYTFTPATNAWAVLKDIEPGPASSFPQDLIFAAGRIYFLTTTDADGAEIYVTDGTTPGTRRISDLVPGFNGEGWATLGAAGGRMLFWADGAGAGLEVWAHDGSSLVRLTHLDDSGGAFYSMNPWGFSADKFVFTIGGGSELIGPIVTDGTPAGTMLFSDAVPQSVGATRVGGSVGPFEYFRVGEFMYRYDGTAAALVAQFPSLSYGNGLPVAFDAGLIMGAGLSTPGFSYNNEPWFFDPVSHTGTPLAEIHPGTAGLQSQFGAMAAAGRRVVLTGPSTSGMGVEPFGSDGTPEGTALLGDLTPGASSSVQAMFNAGPRAMCIIGNRWWSTDGTPSGTTQLPLFAPTSFPSPMVGTLNGRSIIAARHLTANVGFEPYITDGTVAGTMLIKNITLLGSASPAPFEDSNPSGFVELNGRVYFNAQSNDFGYELWASDGTTEGTYQVKDINPGINSSWSGLLLNQLSLRRVMAAHNGLIYFAAQSSGASPVALELYKTDGTSAGTELVADLNPGSAGSLPDLLTSAQQGLFFTASVTAGASPTGRELYITDGTVLGTRLVKNITAGAGQTSFGAMCAVGGASTGAPAGVVFACRPNDTSINQLWFSDGTDTGTVRLGTNLTIETQFATTFPPALVPHRGRAYFIATTNNNSTLREVWQTDGTAAGTCMLANVLPDPAFSFTGDHGKLLTLANNRLFAVLESPMWGREVHVFDLCPADFDNSGGDPVIDDLFLYLNAWFSGAPVADFDHAGGVSVDDLFRYLNAWFGGCGA